MSEFTPYAIAEGQNGTIRVLYLHDSVKPLPVSYGRLYGRSEAVERNLLVRVKVLQHEVRELKEANRHLIETIRNTMRERHEGA